MEHVWNNNTDLDIGPGDDQVARSSICTYNGVEYLEVSEENLTLRLSNYIFTYSGRGGLHSEALPRLCL